MNVEPTTEFELSVERTAKAPFAPVIGSALYGVIYADPPWRYDNGGAQGGVDEQYPTTKLTPLPRERAWTAQKIYE